MKPYFLSSIAPKTLLAALIFGALSCTKKDDASPSGTTTVDLPATVVDTYRGQLSYVGSSLPISSTNGTATIARTGDKTYSITFSNNVPALTNMKFQAASGGSYASVSSGGSVSGITISPSSLSVSVSQSNQTWGFTGAK